jgi:hypothetical protein
MKSDPLRDKKYKLLSILKNHHVQGMKEFMAENPADFSGILPEQKADNQYVFDLLHVYKANLIYLGKQYFESMKYCVDKGFIKLSEDMEKMLHQADGLEEGVLEACFIQESVLEEHQ